jgi:uncharacterized membrane protein
MGTDEDNGTSIACSITPSTRALGAAPIAQANMVMIVVVPALASAPFGMPATAFWIYVCASLLFIIGLIKIFGDLPQGHGVDKVMPFGRLFFAIPMAVFGSEHFTATANIATLVPRWIPAHTFWVYLVGLGFLCAALSIVVLVEARLAAALVGMTLLIFVFVMDMPAVVANPRNRFFWGSGPERTRLQRRRFRFRDVAVEHSAETAVARTVGRGAGRHSAILRGHSFAVLWGGASAAPGIRTGNSAAKAHSRVDSRANFLELFCWRDSDSRRRLLARE